ncbi:hypothetical protein HOG27_02170 [bacterium]|jgi:hypothetical protein|nr:hypothetical protein [bacterium]
MAFLIISQAFTSENNQILVNGSHSNTHHSKNSCLSFVTEYVYSLSVSGSFGPLSQLPIFVFVDFQNVHCDHTSDHE